MGLTAIIDDPAGTRQATPRDGQAASLAPGAVPSPRNPLKSPLRGSRRPLMADLLAERLGRRPYCTDNPDRGVYQAAPARALRSAFLQVNPPHLRCWLVFDIDREGAALAPERAELPQPSITCVNRENSRAHLAYGLDAPVLLDSCANARKKPARYLAAVERAMLVKLGADPGYAGLLTKNPCREDLYRVLWGAQALCLARAGRAYRGFAEPLRAAPRGEAGGSGSQRGYLRSAADVCATGGQEPLAAGRVRALPRGSAGLGRGLHRQRARRTAAFSGDPADSEVGCEVDLDPDDTGGIPGSSGKPRQGVRCLQARPDCGARRADCAGPAGGGFVARGCAPLSAGKKHCCRHWKARGQGSCAALLVAFLTPSRVGAATARQRRRFSLPWGNYLIRFTGHPPLGEVSDKASVTTPFCTSQKNIRMRPFREADYCGASRTWLQQSAWKARGGRTPAARMEKGLNPCASPV